MAVRVVVLCQHSLFASGIASRLREFPDLFDVQTIDVEQFDAPRRIRRAKPAIVLVDAIDTSVTEKLPIGKLLEALPEVKIMQIVCNSDEIRIFSSEQRRAQELDDLIAMMQTITPASNQARYA